MTRRPAESDPFGAPDAAAGGPHEALPDFLQGEPAPDEALPDFLQGEPARDDQASDALRRQRAALCSADPAVALAAVAQVHAAGNDLLQVEVAAVLQRHASSAGHAGVQAVLDCLDALADGRVVRTLEAVLHEKGAELGEHHAWRTRHIIQRIRRSGRR